MPGCSRSDHELEHYGESCVGDIEFGGITRQAYLDFVPEATIGDYVIVHVGFAISRVDAEEANDFSSCDEILDEFRDPRSRSALADCIAR